MRGADAAVAGLAAAQHGVVGRRQLHALGLGRGAIDRRLERGRLHRVHYGVYAVGHAALAREGRWMAAVLAGGDGAVLSHWSAASLWRLRPGGGPRSHVTARGARRSRATIAFHLAALAADEVTEEEGIPVTTPARTLLDLAPLLPSPALARAVERAEVEPVAAGAPLTELIDRHGQRAGVPKLRAILADPIRRTRSDLEARFVELARASGLPRPEINGLVDLPDRRVEADLVWRAQRLVVELDVFATHGSTFAFERDRARDRALQAAGWTVIRVTDRQLIGERAAIVADLRRVLGAAAPATAA